MNIAHRTWKQSASRVNVKLQTQKSELKFKIAKRRNFTFPEMEQSSFNYRAVLQAFIHDFHKLSLIHSLLNETKWALDVQSLWLWHFNDLLIPPVQRAIALCLN